MDKLKDHSEEEFQRALTHRLRKNFHSLQKLEQRMILLGHRSDQIAIRMQQARESIQNSMPGQPPLKRP